MCIGIAWLILCGAGVANASVPGGCRDDVPATTPTATFTVHNDGTVTHHATGLMWMRCSLGQVWDGSSCTGEATRYNWQDALQAAEGYTFAGKSDWRVPNVEELESIVEYSCYRPAINKTIFPAIPWYSFWTSSPYVYGNDDAWHVDFNYGDSYDYRRDESLFVRLVRSGSN